MSPNAPRQQLTILEAMVLIAGIAFSLWLFEEDLDRYSPWDVEGWVMIAVAVLGGISLAGGPMLVVDRIRNRRRWRSGALLWFAISLAAWGLAPALTVIRVNPGGTTGSMAGPCFFYSLPLMGLFSLVACAVAGRPARRWWTCRGWWPEWFGMWVLVGWSATGAYVLFEVYKDLF
jgi:hypothetical protein